MSTDESSERLSRRGFFQKLRRAVPDLGPFRGSGAAPEERAIDVLEEAGISVLQLSRQENLLQIQCKRDTDDFGDDEMELLRPLAKRVSWLDMGNTNITNEGIQIVAEMPRLRRLYLQNTLIGNDGLAALSDLEELEYLNLYGTNVSDEGLDHLLGCTSLETLYLWQTDVTEEGIDRLRAKLPELEVTFGSSYFDSRDESYDVH